MENKKRLVELIECLEHCADNTDCESCSRWLYPCDEHCVDDLLATAAKELKKLVDAVEVVQCKDCKFGDMCSIREAMATSDRNAYCYRGERRTDGR